MTICSGTRFLRVTFLCEESRDREFQRTMIRLRSFFSFPFIFSQIVREEANSRHSGGFVRPLRLGSSRIVRQRQIFGTEIHGGRLTRGGSLFTTAFRSMSRSCHRSFRRNVRRNGVVARLPVVSLSKRCSRSRKRKTSRSNLLSDVEDRVLVIERYIARICPLRGSSIE